MCVCVCVRACVRACVSFFFLLFNYNILLGMKIVDKHDKFYL